MNSRRRHWLTVAAVLVLAGCGDSSAPSPRTIAGFTFNFDGTVTSSCSVIGPQACADTAFGSGVAAGTTVTGSFTIDSTAAPTVILEQSNYKAIRYYGVVGKIIVGSTTLSGNDVAGAYVEIDAAPTFENYTVVIPRGFTSGTVGGLSIDYVVISVPILPSKFPDVAPARNPEVFQAGVTSSTGANIGLKHNTDPNLWALGLVAPGVLLESKLSAIH